MRISIKWGNVGNWFCAMGGVLIGLGASPLVFHLSDKSGVASVVGAALGAGITVLGALWLNKSKEIKERKAIRKAAVKAVRILDGPWQRVESSYSRLQILVDEGKHDFQLSQEVSELTAAFYGLHAVAGVVLNQFESLTSVYHACGPTVAVAHFHITGSIDNIKHFSEDAGRRLRGELYGCIQDHIAGSIYSIREFHKDLTEDLGQI